MKVLIYDDHNFVTEAIASYIKNQTDAEVTACCHSIDEVRQQLALQEPDIIISDILSDEDAGISLFTFLTKSYPDIRVVAYTSVTNTFIIDALYDSGVFAVVNKKEHISVLWETVLRVCRERKSMSKNTGPKNNLPFLTVREKEIAIYLSKGLAAKEIADLLGTSVNTTNNQKNALLEKFDCNNSTELVVKLSQMGLLGIL